jgi:hypothetical protein
MLPAHPADLREVRDATDDRERGESACGRSEHSDALLVGGAMAANESTWLDVCMSQPAGHEQSNSIQTGA